MSKGRRPLIDIGWYKAPETLTPTLAPRVALDLADFGILVLRWPLFAGERAHGDMK